MLQLKKPGMLCPGDRVAAVSLSWGAAGNANLRWRYELGKRRMEQDFGLQVVEMPHTLASEQYVSDHPEKRAEDLMAAFADDSIRGIFNVIGGSDSIRMLPYIDFALLAAHPKVFAGYSDGTVTDFICMKAGFSSFYGAHVLNDFGETGQMPDYTADLVRRMLFSAQPVGKIAPSPVYSGTDTDWTHPEAQRSFQPDFGYQCLQGGVAHGPLIGGCFEVFEDLKETPLFPPLAAFQDAILFFEVCRQPDEKTYRTRLRDLGARGILGGISGLLMGKPLGGMPCYSLYNKITKEVLAEYGRADLPVLSNGSFGHNSPSGVIPMGAMAELDCCTGSFTILEGVTQPV